MNNAQPNAFTAEQRAYEAKLIRRLLGLWEGQGFATREQLLAKLAQLEK